MLMTSRQEEIMGALFDQFRKEGASHDEIDGKFKTMGDRIPELTRATGISEAELESLAAKVPEHASFVRKAGGFLAIEWGEEVLGRR